MTASFQPVTCTGKLTTQSTFLRVTQADGPKACLSLTTPPVIKSGQIMPSQLSGWLKVHVLCSPLFSISHSFQPQRRAGSTIWAVNACVTDSSLLVICSHFTLQTTTLPCLGGLRAWKPSFMNRGCGQNRGCWLHSAWSSIVPLVILIVAAGGFFSHSLILKVKGCSFKSLSRDAGTSVTST